MSRAKSGIRWFSMGTGNFAEFVIIFIFDLESSKGISSTMSTNIPSWKDALSGKICKVGNATCWLESNREVFLHLRHEMHLAALNTLWLQRLLRALHNLQCDLIPFLSLLINLHSHHEKLPTNLFYLSLKILIYLFSLYIF